MQVERYRFRSVNDVEFGSIVFSYFRSGLVKEERWIKQPGERTVRLFEYRYEPATRLYELKESDSTGSVISRVALVLPVESETMIGAADALLGAREETPPGAANVLEESVEIIEDIRGRRSRGWNPGAEKWPDTIYLKNGDTLEVELIRITEESIRFRLFGEEEVLTMPLSAVGEVERKDGEIIYPILY